MRDNNVDLIVDKLIKEGDKLTPSRIEAFSKVISSLKGHTAMTQEPNEVKEDPNSKELTDDTPLDFSEIEGVQFGQTGSKKKVKIVPPQE